MRLVQVLLPGGQQALKVFVKHQQGFDAMYMHELMYLDGDGNSTHFITTKGRKVTCAHTLKECAEPLLEHGFYRTNKGMVINLCLVKSYSKPREDNTGGKVSMQDGTRLEVSRRRKEGLLESLFGEEAGSEE